MAGMEKGTFYRKVILLLALGTVVITCFFLAGCGEKDDTGPATGAESTENTEGAEEFFPMKALTAMAEVEVENFSYDEMELVYGYGNIKVEELTEALHDAASKVEKEDFAEEQKRLQTQFEAGSINGFYWGFDADFLEDGKEYVMGDSLPFFSFQCGLAKDLVQVTYGRNSLREHFYLKHRDLYEMILHKSDYEASIDEEAFARFEDILTAKMESVLDMMKENPGQFHSYELTMFEKTGEYTEEDGSLVELYNFDYKLLTDHPEKIGWAGGMQLDSQLRLYGFNGGGQFVVRCRNGEVTATAFMGNDFYYDPDDPYPLDVKEARERLKGVLDHIEKNKE